MSQVQILNFCTITFYDGYMLVVMNEGVSVTAKLQDVLVEKALDYYHKKPFVYLTHRINSYSVDPSIYFETSKLETLAGFGVIAKDYKAKINAEIEKLFLKKPFRIFEELDEAISWAKSLIE
ncbi:hypothetical protein [Paucihalobacter sp.]|uniref:hypothetical protein n=1 Tax=Paucihalobacter sp. TaxID=2850405 RepID=UPI002FE32655